MASVSDRAKGIRSASSAPGWWHSSLGPGPARPPLEDDIEADVCIVGAGYTGLWTAWALLRAEPSLRVVILEAETVGFGASGRNGGWLSALMPGNRARMAAGPAGADGVRAFQGALADAVGRVAEVCVEEGIDADLHVGGTLTVAVNAAQETRLRAAMEEDLAWGAQPVWLSPQETAGRLRVSGMRAATWNPGCARIHPAKLVRGLAGAVERRGGLIFECSRVSAIEPGVVRVERGPAVRAPWSVVATEGYTTSLPGRRRRLLPMNSSIVVTRPLPSPVWDELGWQGMETLADGAHIYSYLQRTADDRIAIGGRGVPYRFGSAIDDRGHCPPATVAQLTGSLLTLFPVLGDPAVTGWKSTELIEAAWSGVLGVARDWCPSVGVRREGKTGVAWAGGYVGDGVTTSHLAGLTLADLLLDRPGPLTALPWVGHASRDWEPEPLRWLGVRSIYGLYRVADRGESRRAGRPTSSVWARLAGHLDGR